VCVIPLHAKDTVEGGCLFIHRQHVHLIYNGVQLMPETGGRKGGNREEKRNNVLLICIALFYDVYCSLLQRQCKQAF
jgi:hypothetical protein